MDQFERPEGISRRRMLKRIGAGAAIAWSAPVLTSLRIPAFAQATSGVCTGCTCDFFNNPTGCNGDDTCFCDQPVEGGPCICDGATFFGECTSSAQCQEDFGTTQIHCVCDDVNNTSYCVPECGVIIAASTPLGSR